MSGPVLLTEAEWRNVMSYHKDIAIDYIRERGLIASEPVDPLLAEVENIFKPVATENEAKCLILAALRRGRDIGRAELTRERVREALAQVDIGLSDRELAQVHAALTGQQGDGE